MSRFFDLSQKPEAEELTSVPLGGTRAQAVQRLQIGVTGVMLMILMVGLASIIQNRVAESDAVAVPEAAPTTEPTEPNVQNDPLAEAGVVPDMPAAPETPQGQGATQPAASSRQGTNGGQ